MGVALCEVGVGVASCEIGVGVALCGVGVGVVSVPAGTPGSGSLWAGFSQSKETAS